jgi:hypothetical protein
VVIDWGFPVSCLPAVQTLIASGVEPWWFDGDRDAALQSFLARPDHPATRADWDRQITAIQQHWNEIKVVFTGRILDVVSAGPVHLPNEARWDLIRGLH